MVNKILKIALPLIILGVIVFVINRTQKSIDRIAPTEVNPFSFGSYINDLIQSDLKDKPYAQAKDEYRRIYDIIKTEEHLMATDSTGNRQSLLSDTTAQGCYRRVFAGYYPAYEAFAEGVFRSDWSSKTDLLNEIKTEAEDLQQRDGSAVRNDSLTRYLAYISDYNAAIGFVTNVSCSSKSDYEQLATRKDAYRKKYPLRNNSSLIVKLDEVPGKAKSKWESSVITSVNNVCRKTTLNDFLNAKSGCEGKISEYNTYFSSDKLSANETTIKLRNRWYTLLTYEVDDACRIDNLSNFSPVYTDLRNKIDAFGSDPDELKERLKRKYNELREETN